MIAMIKIIALKHQMNSFIIITVIIVRQKVLLMCNMILNLKKRSIYLKTLLF